MSERDADYMYLYLDVRSRAFHKARKRAREWVHPVDACMTGRLMKCKSSRHARRDAGDGVESFLPAAATRQARAWRRRRKEVVGSWQVRSSNLAIPKGQLGADRWQQVQLVQVQN